MQSTKPREKIKKEHEHYVISDYLKWHNTNYEANYTINETPEYTDAIAFDGASFIWIEHANVYRSQYEAKEEWSLVTPGEEPFNRGNCVIKNFPDLFADSFIAVLESKLYKESYKDLFLNYGKGILLLSERDPLFIPETWEIIKNRLSEKKLEQDRGYFEKVFLAYRSNGGLSFIEVEYRKP